MHTFVVIEMTEKEPGVIAHVKTTYQAINIVTDMQSANPGRKFYWLMVPKAK